MPCPLHNILETFTDDDLLGDHVQLEMKFNNSIYNDMLRKKSIPKVYQNFTEIQFFLGKLHFGRFFYF